MVNGAAFELGNAIVPRFGRSAGHLVAGNPIRYGARAEWSRVSGVFCAEAHSGRCLIGILDSKSPWHNWIARRPPEPKVRGSNPLGDT